MNLRQDDCLGGWVGLHHDNRSIIMAGESAPGRFSPLKSMNLRQDDCLGGWVGLHHDSRSIIMAGESAPGSFSQLNSKMSVNSKMSMFSMNDYA